MSTVCLKIPNKKQLWNLNKIFYKLFSTHQYDVIIVGGGIIGTAIAKTIKSSRKTTKIALIEKEPDLALHQSSHNSQVIHAGIYYRPDSLKAKLCVKGCKLIYDYCESKKIPVKKTGKLIIGHTFLDKIRLKELYRVGLKNNVPGLELLDDWKKVEEIQPNCQGHLALWSPNTGNINWEIVTKNFGNDFRSLGGDIFLNCQINSIKESTDPSYPLLLTETTKRRMFLTKFVVLCLGLHSGTLLKSDRYKNISLKITYYLLNPKLNRFIKSNIYAMPHLDLPFIGIHFSPILDGSVLLGPTAVPAFTLDDYSKNAISRNYIQNNILSRGYGLLFLKNFQACLHQVVEAAFTDTRTSQLKKYFPMLGKNDMVAGPTALQGQLLTDDGELVDDFLIDMFEGHGIRKRIVDCRFVPSPGATASLAIAQMVNSEITKKLLS